VSLLRKLYYYLKIGIKLIFPPAYAIKRGYLHRSKTLIYHDNTQTDEWQREVYEFAAELAEKKQLETLIDIGCGSGYKLKKYFNKIEFAGVETEKSFDFLKTNYPANKWFEYKDPYWKNFPATLVLCCDVIEHVPNPDSFMRALLEIKTAEFFIISTPDRQLVQGDYPYGPPKNEAHYREWTQKEFRTFIGRYLIISEQFISNMEQGTQVIVGTKKLIG
jgi:hypothetical protein